jgi:hypothetical protein
MEKINMEVLKEDLNILKQVIRRRVLGDAQLTDIVEDFQAGPGKEGTSPYERLLSGHKMMVEERIVLLLATAPHFMPDIFDLFYDSEINQTLSFSRIGGRTNPQTRVFLPTGRLALFVLGEDWHYSYMFSQEHFFRKNNILSLTPVTEGVPFIDGVLTLSDEYLNYLGTGEYEPRYGENFPAKKASTELEWDDLVIRKETMAEVNEIKGWIRHELSIMQNPVLKKKIRRGYRALFYGRSGTGKTLTATLLGKSFDKPIYSVDLSMVVSKYVGETEKNLEKIFNMAESRGWILFFDEAEALFGKRSGGGTANDRYANQEVSYLLQRIEDYDGILILASNKLFDIDEAFTRRFQSIIEFPEPNAEERLILWEKTFDQTGFEISTEVDFKKLAEGHAITGGMLVNVLRYCAIKVMERGDNRIIQEDLILGLKKEYLKERKMWVETPVKTTVPRVQMKGNVN